MSLLAAILGSNDAAHDHPPPPDSDFWYGGTPASPSLSGMPVTTTTAMRLATVFACVKVVGETVGTLPLKVYRRLPNGGREEAPDHPLAFVLHEQPNAVNTTMDYQEGETDALLLRGNAYVEPLYDGAGQILELVPHVPDLVQPEQIAPGSRRLRYRISDGYNTRVLLDTEIHHIRGLSRNGGLTGISVIDAMRDVVGLAQAAQEYASEFYRNGAVPLGVATHPGDLGDEGMRNVQESWQRAHGAGKRHTLAVLEEGMEYKSIGVSARDAQLMEARNFQAIDIVRFFRVPPHKVAILERATFSNIEQQAIEFVTDTIAPWARRIETAIMRDLMTREERREFFVEFTLEQLLRGDIKSRFAAYQSAITSGWMAGNEVRRRENLNPIDGLDEPRVPLNTAAIDDDDEASTAPDDRNDPGEQDPTSARASAILMNAAGKLARKELVVLGKILNRADGQADIERQATEFYRDFAGNVADVLQVPTADAVDYASNAYAQLCMADDPEALIASWAETKTNTLAHVAGLNGGRLNGHG